MENTHNEPVASKSVRGTDGTATPPALLTSPFTRHDGWTGEKIAIFCEALAETAVVAEACDQAGMGISGAYAFRRRSPIFAAAWDAALTIARERLADTLLARSMEGNIELLWKDGEVVGERHLLDNRLGLAILKRLDRIAERDQCSCAMSGTHRSPNGAGSRSWSPAQTRTPAVRSEPFDWNLAIDALRTGNEDDICKALALIKGDEVEEVEDPPFYEDQIDLSHRCWTNDEGEWMTSFPPPAGFSGYENCEWGDPDETYERECTAEESAILEADAKRLRDLERADDEQQRDEWFALLRGDSEIVNSDQACIGPEPRQNCCVAPSMDRDTLDHIRDRVERCRRLASQTTDERARVALLELANEGEADLRRLEEEMEKGEQDSPAIPPPQSTA